jgi:hypothetical protein
MKELWSYLGMANLSLELTPHYFGIALPLKAMTRGNEEFRWINKQQQSFKGLKKRSCNVMVLALPKSKITF